MKKINTFFLLLIISSLVVTFILTLLPKKAFAILNRDSLSCMGTTISSSPFSTLFFLGAGVLLGVGFLSALIQIIKTQLFLNSLLKKKVNPPSNLIKIFQKLNIKDKVVLVKDKNLFSFCTGFVFPFIVISTSLVKSLTDKELEAVLLHEQSHLLNKDPLKVFIGKTLSSMFFFLPIFTDLHKNAEGVSEFLADQWTIKYQKKSEFLKNALKKVLTNSSENLKLVSNASSPDYFEIRIHRLVNPETKYRLKISLFSFITTFLFITASVLLLNTPADAHMQNPVGETSAKECLEDQSCQKDCHPQIKQNTDYIPAQLIMPEKICN